jgi:hypothetical protein
MRNLWLVPGSESSEAMEFCRSRAINLIHGECPLMFARPKGMLRLHRWLWGVLGKQPT